MADESSVTKSLSFKLDPSGQDLSVMLKCKGIATGIYTVQFRIPGQSDQVRTGNIETPERHQFPAGAELTGITVSVKSVPFLASDPGGYQLFVEQPGGERIETPLMPYDTVVEIIITGAGAPKATAG
jgi:hypothetical protein